MSLPGRLTRLVGHWRDLPAETARAWRVGGLREVRQLFADRSVHLVFRRDRMVVIAQRLDGVREVPAPAGVTISIATAADVDRLAGMVGARDLDLFRARHAAGRTCLLAWRDGRPIGYTWLSEHVGPDVTICPLPLPSHAAYLYDLYVVPAERSSGVGSALVSARLRLARERGFIEGWRMISVGNRASFRTVDKTGGTGTRVVGEMRYYKVLDRIYPRFTPAPDAARP
ncbi:MAG TPA: GNAT family N-acetyltransferase [Gemmatimonadales bacterium]|jgi:GNAT superfamily N-acetyltransferase